MANITLVAKDILGVNARGRIHVELELVSQATPGVFIPSVQILELVAGSVSFTVPNSISATYWYEPETGGVRYLIGSLSPSGNGDFGTLLRTAAAQSTGAHSFVTVAGSMQSVASPPALAVNASISNCAIARDGVVFVPTPSPITIASVTGVYSLTLPQTATLYSGSGRTVDLFLQQRSTRIGSANFTVPTVTSGYFSVTNGAVVILEG
jgi:hypothetical protein